MDFEFENVLIGLVASVGDHHATPEILDDIRSVWKPEEVELWAKERASYYATQQGRTATDAEIEKEATTLLMAAITNRLPYPTKE